MKLDEYIKKFDFTLPRLSEYYKEYSKVFKEYYKWVNDNMVAIVNKDNEYLFFCFKHESNEYERMIEQKHYCFNDYESVATIEDINRIEKFY